MPTHNQFILDSNGKPNPIGLTYMGAFFPIEVQLPPQIAQTLVAAGKPMPNCVKGLALIDTGATMTCIDEPVLTGLGLNPVGVVNSGTANGPVKQNIYPARIVFPAQGWTVDITQVTGVNLAGQVIPTTPPAPIIALIGRNILLNWVFIYNGPGGFWTVTM